VFFKKKSRFAGRRDEHLVAAADELELQLRPYAVEHLELEAVTLDVVIGGEADRMLDQPLVVCGDGRVAAACKQALEQALVRGVDIRLAWVRN